MEHSLGEVLSLPDANCCDALVLLRENGELRTRVQQLLAANNEELRRRRMHEADANQEYAEKLLLRNECARLREVLSRIGAFLDSRATIVPDDIADALEALFPPDPPAAEAKTRGVHG